MLRKILKIIVKAVLSFFLLYLVLGFILLPLLAYWIIPWQGSKILQSPVVVKSVYFNPFDLKLTINGLSVGEQDDDPLVSFEKFVIDVSFKDLFHKRIRVENVLLSGLHLNVVLLEKGEINLLSLVPETPVEKDASLKETDREGKEPPQDNNIEEPLSKEETSSKPMPLIMVDSILLDNGSLVFEDQNVNPHFMTTIKDMNLSLSGFSTDPESQTKVSFSCQLDQDGKIDMEAVTAPFKQPLFLETNFKLNNYAMNILSPYVGKYTGKELENGKLDVAMHYVIADEKISASHQLIIQHFEFGDKVESEDALSLPFGLAVALLEDPQGKIDISLPVKGDMSEPDFEYLHLIGQVIKNFFIKIVTKPFSVMASLVGGSDMTTEEIAQVLFLPGQDQLREEEKQKLSVLVKGLEARPRLSLKINGTYYSQGDWDAIQENIIQKDYAQLRLESTKTDAEVYQILYQRHFGLQALWDLTKKYKKGVGDYEEGPLIEEIKRQLIKEAPPDENALKELAQSRAQKIYDYFIESSFDAKRLNIGLSKAVDMQMGYIPTEFTLTFYENKDQESK